MMYFEAVVIVVLANGFVATTGQYADIFQELQALLQPFQLNTDTNRYYGVTTRRPGIRKHGDRLSDEVPRRNNPINNYNLFSTTTKPSKKSTRPNSSQYRPTTRKPYKKTETTRQPWESDNIYNYNNQASNYNTNANYNKNVNRFNNNINSGTNVEYDNRRPSNYNNNVATTESNAKLNNYLNNKPNNYNNNEATTESNAKLNNYLNNKPNNYNNNEATTESNAKLNNYLNNKPNDRRPTQNVTVNDINNSYSTVNNLGTINEPSRVVSNRNVNVSGIASITNTNRVTTKEPYLARPGVRPASVDENLPPITNKPVTQPPYVTNPRPSDVGVFTEGPNISPTIEIGPDEDDMTPAERSRYIDLAESMCDNYKALSVKEVVALPLVPSPQGVAVNVSNCTPLNIALIIGGKVSNIEEFPHMALVGWKNIQQNSYSWKCGGSLVSDQYVLTAGHCTYQEKDYNVVSGPPQAVQLGSSLVENPNALVVKIASVIRHPKYKQRWSYYDVALIKMATRVTFSDVIRPACLGVPPRVGRPIIATGWGRTEFGGDQSNELRSVSIPIWDMQECRRIWGTTLKLPNGPTFESQICAGERSGGKDTCQGDSGGPAQVQEGCAWRVVAVTSYGRSCGAPQTPALYATIPRVFVAAQVFGKHRSSNNPKKQYENINQNNGYGSQQYQSVNQQQNNNAYENQQQNNNAYASQQQNNNAHASQQQNNNAHTSQQQNNNAYASQQQNNNAYASQQQNNNAHASQQQNNNPYASQQQNINKYDNIQQNYDYLNKKKPQYESSESTNNGYTSSQYNNNLYDNKQNSNEHFSQQQLNVNKFNNQQQTTSRYNNNRRQNDNRYNNQQIGGTYEQNTNTYQQLSIRDNQRQTEWWNKQNGNTADELPTGGWKVTDEISSWSQLNHNNHDGSYFTTTVRPWWAR